MDHLALAVSDQARSIRFYVHYFGFVPEAEPREDGVWILHDAAGFSLAIGQIEGGSAQGLGYALLEDVVMRDGRMANAQLTNYIVPTTLDTPPSPSDSSQVGDNPSISAI